MNQKELLEFLEKDYCDVLEYVKNKIDSSEDIIYPLALLGFRNIGEYKRDKILEALKNKGGKK